ncbi:MAG: metallophosphoesterase family protein [Bacillota bacterium]
MTLRGYIARISGKLTGRGWRLTAVELFAVVVGAVLFVTVFGPAVYDVQGVSFRGELRPALNGRTVLEIPPVGSLTADTHSTPVEIHITVQGVRPDILGRQLYPQVDSNLINNFEAKSQQSLTAFAARQAAAGALGAVVVFWALARPPWTRLIRAGVSGTLLIALILGLTLHTYDRSVFREPEYHGLIAAAPRVMHTADQLLDKLQDFQDKTDLLVNNIQILAGQVDRLFLLETTSEESTRRVLVIADIHNNPVGLDFTQALVHHFQVDMVLDAGDLTDFGSPLEAQAAAKPAGLGVPYVFAPGNHDSTGVIDFVRGLPNGRVLNGKVEDVQGLKILGSPDPWAYGDAVTAADADEERLLLQEQIDQLRDELDRAETKPDILLVHHPDVARAFAGEIPILISGHTHRTIFENLEGSWHVNPGSTGAAGLRGLQSASEIPYAAVIIHFDGTDRTPVVADFITHHSLSGRFTVERRLMGPPDTENGTAIQGLPARPAAHTGP